MNGYTADVKRWQQFTASGLAERWEAVALDPMKAELWTCGHMHRSRTAANRCVKTAQAVAMTAAEKAHNWQPLPVCPGCRHTVDPLEVFPGGLCLTCWAESPEGRRMPKAAELTAMWGGRV